MTPENSEDHATSKSLTFPILSDVGRKVAREYGLVFVVPADVEGLYKKFGIDLAAANGDTDNELPIPATYVIAKDGTITWAHRDLDYRTRAEPGAILDALKALKK